MKEAGHFPPHETRLFPKNRGADAYALTGLAARCDMVVLSDLVAPNIHVHRRLGGEPPRHIFLSLRAPFHALRFFAEDVMPHLSAPFILVSGSEDITLPRQTDRRWRGYSAKEGEMLDQILAHPLLRHWYAENLDQAGHPKRSPLPLGMVYPEGTAGQKVRPAVPALAQRPGRAFCAHRLREGPQWEVRRHVTALAEGPWRSFCSMPQAEIPESAFIQAIAEHAFVICVEGGGLDPSPKAWLALANGAVPIVRRTALADAYAHLPVAFIDDWTEEALSEAKLKEWQAHLAPAFDTPAGRDRTLFRLSLDYWWQLVSTATPIRAPEKAIDGGAATG